MSTRSWRRSLTAVTSVAAVVGLSLTGASAASAAGRVSYPGSVPAWASHTNDTGTASAATTEEGEIYLPLQDEVGAEALATAVSTPGSPQYRHNLSAARWIARYAPTQAAVNQVVSYLTANGLTITAVPQDRLFVIFRGTAAQLGTVFGTSLHSYNHGGVRLLAPARAPSVPASLASDVAAISLDQSKLLAHSDAVAQGSGSGAASAVTTKAATPNASSTSTPVIVTPCSSYIGQNTVTVPAAYAGTTSYSTYNCGYTPAQVRSAYGIQGLSKAGLTGRGQTVAIVDAYASPSIVSDVNTYSAAVGEPGLARGQYRQIVDATSTWSDEALCQDPSGWQSEQTLDVEAVHGIAPAANILYFGGYNCAGGLDLALSKILDGQLANLVSNSWGDTGEDLSLDVLTGESHIFLQAAAEGIGLYFSSGDNGDEVANVGQPEPDFPASSPWVTAVGGTSVAISSTGSVAWQTGWGDTFDQILAGPSGTLSYKEALPGTRFVGGAGGGTSTVFAQPAYQKGIVPTALAAGKRVSPDIAALADPYTGFSIGISPISDNTTLATGAFERVTYGGTSLASPLTAAEMALVQQATWSTIGFANPSLYAVDRVLPSAFTDVLSLSPTQALVYTSKISGNTYLVSIGQDSSLTTTRGYDNVTGLGGLSFNLLRLVAAGRH